MAQMPVEKGFWPCSDLSSYACFGEVCKGSDCFHRLLRGEITIADPYDGPILFILFDELQMPWRRLVGIVGRPITKHAVQRDIKILIHIAIQIGHTPAYREINQSFMVVQILLASRDQSSDGRIAAIVERKEDVVGQHHLSGDLQTLETSSRASTVPSTRGLTSALGFPR